MNVKKALTLILSLSLIFSLAACNEPENKADSQADNPTDSITDTVTSRTEEHSSEYITVNSTTAPESTDISAEETSAAETQTFSSDPADWSTAQIIEAYKNAAAKSASTAISSQSITLNSISVNNGEFEGFFDFIASIMSKLLKNNSTDKNGITGGYRNLSEADTVSAKAYKSGNNTVIELVMKEQTAGANEDANSGSVGHAITAVGDISQVTKQMKDLGLPLDIPEANTKIHYTDPTVRVLINSSGEIVNGTWSYTVEIFLHDYKAFGQPVNTTSVIMHNTVTVNGGFKK